MCLKFNIRMMDEGFGAYAENFPWKYAQLITFGALSKNSDINHG